MRKQLLAATLTAVACLAGTVAIPTVEAQGNPERSLLGVRLGRSHREVLALYGGPDEIRTVTVPSTLGAPVPGGDPGMMGGAFGATAGGSGAPSMGGSGGPMMSGAMVPGQGPPMGMSGGMGAPGGSGSPYGNPFGGTGAANPFGGGDPGLAGGSGGPPVLPPGGDGGFGATGPGMGMGGAAAGPEYSSALLWVYKRGTGGNVRLEFLINEDGRVAQISIAAPARDVTRAIASRRGAQRIATSRGITLGSNYSSIITAYGFPERTRMIPPRFIESYYTKNYHCAFTVDAAKNRQVVRITITLAD